MSWSGSSRCAIARGDRLGIVGPNGAGKTTLLNHADRGAGSRFSGTVKLGTALEMVTLDQRREQPRPGDWTLADALTGGRAPIR
jgi:ATP-binding cassette subfamily F protein uup